MSDGLDQQHQARDRFGRFQKGHSGHPAGRTPGSKNRKFRRKADPERAAEWTANDWRVFYQRTFQEAEGAPGEKHGAAWVQCMGLWLSLNPARQQPGSCGYCNKRLDTSLSSVSGAPILVHGAWTHWSCLPHYCRSRWESAKNALRRLGITENVF